MTGIQPNHSKNHCLELKPFFLKMPLIINTLNMIVKQHQAGKKMITHSDRDSQYRSSIVARYYKPSAVLMYVIADTQAEGAEVTV